MPTVVFFSQTSYKTNDTSFNNPTYGNYKFDTDLTSFAVMRERKFRKVNRIQSLLKLKENKDLKSIYPMIDEFGYSISDFFIFKSTWDYEYSVETTPPTFERPKDMTPYFTKEKFYTKHLFNADKVIREWEESLDFTVGRPKFDDFK